MKIKLSCDDACASDVRVAELATKYGFECTFYWPVEWHSLAYEKGYKPLRYLDAVHIVDDMGFEVGSHTITHRHLTQLDQEEAEREILESKYMLEDLFEVDVDKFAPPRGYTNSELTKYTLGVYESQRLTKGPGLVHVHPDSGANGNIPWAARAKAMHSVGNLKELWMHSWELDKYNLWGELEEFLDGQS